jgi:1,4-dihydroxy-2-naphthoate octaprenyltransferase
VTTPEAGRGAFASLAHAAEPPRLAASLSAVALGGALAVGEPGPARWPVWGAVALAAFFLQAGGRLLIEAAEARRAHAHAWQSGRSRSALSPGRLAAAAALCFAATLLLGFLALIERGWPLFWFGLGGVVGAVLYSQGPALRDRALGPPLSFVLLGPLPVVAGYLAVTGAWSPLALRVSVPLGLLAAATILAREIRDIVDDARAGATTMAGLLRRPAADFLLLLLFALAYLWLIALVARGLLAPACLLPLLTLPGAIRLFAAVRAAPEDGASGETRLAEKAANLYIRFAVLYAASVAVSELIWKRAV